MKRKRRLRPDIVEKLKTRKTEDIFTIKRTLGSLQPQPITLIPAIESAVAQVQRISFEGSLLLQTVVLHCLKNKVPLPDINQTFVYRCFMKCACSGAEAATPQKTNDPLIETVFQTHYLPLRQSATKEGFGIKSHITQIVNYAAKRYLTACKNHVSLNFTKRLLKFWKRKLIGIDFRSAAHRYALLRFLQNATLSKDPPSFDKLLDWVSTDTAHMLQHQINDFRKRYADLLPAVFPNQVQRNFIRFLPWLFELRNDIDSTVAELGGTEGCVGIRGRLFKTFSMLPLPSWKPKYIDIDTTALYYLWKSGIGDKAEQKEFPKLCDFKANRDFFWKAAFPKLKNVPAGAKKQFNYLLSTDGVAVSLSYVRRRRAQAVTRKPFSCDDNNDNLVIAVDPGARDFISSINSEDNAVVEISSKSWYAGLKTRQATEQTRKVLTKQRGVKTLIDHAPSGLCSNVNDWNIFLRYVLRHMTAIHSAYRTRSLRRLRFGQYVRHQKLTHKVCERITRGVRDSIVAFGDWSAGQQGFGHARGPVQHIKKALRSHCRAVVDIDEYKTSKICSTCDHELIAPRQRKEVPPWKLKRKTTKGVPKQGAMIHGIRICPNCRITWNRDINAAKNILRIYVNEGGNRRRPESLCR